MPHSICPICGQGTLKKEIKDEVFEYKGSTVTIPNYIVHRCNTCREAIERCIEHDLKITDICRDADDDNIIACAVAAKADYLGGVWLCLFAFAAMVGWGNGRGGLIRQKRGRSLLRQLEVSLLYIPRNNLLNIFLARLFPSA